MDEEKIDDIYISQLVLSIEHDEPEIPDISVFKKNKLRNKNIVYFLRTLAATLVLLVGVFLINNQGIIETKESVEQSEIKEISEIRTDFVLRGDNIKIIWIQKKDFKILTRS